MKCIIWQLHVVQRDLYLKSRDKEGNFGGSEDDSSERTADDESSMRKHMSLIHIRSWCIIGGGGVNMLFYYSTNRNEQTYLQVIYLLMQVVFPLIIV